MEISSALLMLKTLDGLSARSVAAAQNIANAGTPNYRPLRLSFEAALKTAAASGDQAVGKLVPKLERAMPGTADAELRPDLELATAAGTALRYSALVEVLNREMQINALAITGNN